MRRMPDAARAFSPCAGWRSAYFATRRTNVSRESATPGPTMTCKLPVEGRANPRGDAPASAASSTRRSSATPISSLVEFASTDRTLVAPPSAARSAAQSSAGLAPGGMLRRPFRISPASWSATGPTTTCSVSAVGRMSPRAPERLQGRVIHGGLVGDHDAQARRAGIERANVGGAAQRPKEGCRITLTVDASHGYRRVFGLAARRAQAEAHDDEAEGSRSRPGRTKGRRAASGADRSPCRS